MAKCGALPIPDCASLIRATTADGANPAFRHNSQGGMTTRDWCALLLARSDWSLLRLLTVGLIVAMSVAGGLATMGSAGVEWLGPKLTLRPRTEANGMMHRAGFFPWVPTQVNFERAFAPVGGRWRLSAPRVSWGQAAPTAPQPPPPASPQA